MNGSKNQGADRLARRGTVTALATVVTATFLFAVAPSAWTADDDWTATLTLTGALTTGGADVSRALTFGVSPSGTSDFDDGLDVASPPAAPSPNPTIYLENTAHTNTHLQQLVTDLRAFEPTGVEEQVWSLYVDNLAPEAWTIAWDISAVTTYWQTARIVNTTAGVDLDMTAASSTTIAAGDAYTYTITVREDGIPASVDIAATTAEDTAGSITLTSEDPTVDTYTVLTQPTNGTLTGTEPDMTYTPDADWVGEDSFTYQADDGILQDSATVTITVTEVNDDPTISAITDPADVLEDSGVSSSITIAGLGQGGGVDETSGVDVQTLTLAATSGNTALIADADLDLSATTWTTGDADPTVTFTPTADISGTAVITITATDDGTTNGGPDVLDVTATFTVTVTDVNDAPTISTITDPADVAEDSGVSADVTIAGLGVGGAADEAAAQTLTLSASSSDETVVAGLTLSTTTWVDGQANPTITFTPTADANGTAVITITATDDGTSNSVPAVLDVTTTFTVTVTEVNDTPTIGSINDPAAVDEDSGTSAAITISGLGVGGGADESAAPQTLTLVPTSSDQTLVPDANLTLSATTWVTGDADPTITYTPADEANGTAVITITATDDGTDDGVAAELDISTTFTVTVTTLNDAPTFDALADISVAEDAAEQTVSITTVSPGLSADESGQTVTFTVASGDTAIIADADLAISGTGATRTLTYTPTADAVGDVTITVTADDSQVLNNTTVDSFVVTVTEVNDVPAVDAIGDQIIAEGVTNSVTVAGLLAGGATDEDAQILTLSATSDTPGVVPDPTFDDASFVEGDTDPTLTFTPIGTGTVTITVTAEDDGADDGVLNAQSITTTFQITVVPVFDADLTVSTGAESHAVTFGFSSSATDTVDLGFADEITDSSGPTISVSFSRDGSGLKKDIIGTPSGTATWSLTAENLSGSAASVGFAWTQSEIDNLLSVAGSYNNAFLADDSSGDTYNMSSSQNGFSISVAGSSTLSMTLTLELSATRTGTPVNISLTANEWHTISLPGSGDLTDLDAVNLSAFTWNATSEVYEALGAMSGLGVVSQGVFMASSSSTTVSLELDVDDYAYRSVDVTLSPGWNLVGAPASQNDSTSWGDATADLLSGGSANRVFAFTSSAGYTVATTLSEGVGYWVLNPDGSDSVVSLTQARHLSGTTTQFFPAPALPAMQWEVPVVMRPHGGAARELTLASARDASDDFDDFDLPQPPPAFGSDGVQFYVRAPHPVRRMTRAVLPVGHGEGEWSVVADAPAGGRLRGVEFGPDPRALPGDRDGERRPVRHARDQGDTTARRRARTARGDVVDRARNDAGAPELPQPIQPRDVDSV